MIIGKGMIANALKEIDMDEVLFFCSGVSNSQETNENEFLREKNLLKSYENSNKKIIYFSSYFLNFKQYLTNRYYSHKLEMEQIIQNSYENYTIYRLPQIVGNSKNLNTLTNYLFNKITNHEPLNIYKNTKFVQKPKHVSSLPHHAIQSSEPKMGRDQE